MINLDLSNMDREIADKLFSPLSDTRIPSVRPLGTQCTEHDFNNLLEMSDEEFNALPPSLNTGLIKSWREMMRNRK